MPKVDGEIISSLREVKASENTSCYLAGPYLPTAGLREPGFTQEPTLSGGGGDRGALINTQPVALVWSGPAHCCLCMRPLPSSEGSF